MPICIECRYPVPQLYHVLHSSSHKPRNPTATSGNRTANSKISPGPSTTATSVNGGTRGGGESKQGAAGGGADVRLTQCPRCKRFADKYVEHDFVVLFIDLVLVKPQVYRHLLFNRLGRDDDNFDPSIIRLGVLLLLFDVYLTWSSIESLPIHLTAPSPVPHLPILLQYAFYLMLCTSTTLALHLAVRSLAATSFYKPAVIATSPTTGAAPTSSNGSGPVPTPTSGSSNAAESWGVSYNSRSNAVSTALFVSSCMKLFPILMVVWRYDDAGGQVAKGVSWAVALQNLEALRILLGCSYFAAGVLVTAGSLAQIAVERIVLNLVGLGAVVSRS